MIKKTVGVILAVSLSTVYFNCQNDRNAYYHNLQSLIEAERSFARLSADSGMRSAFTHWLVNGAIVFRPEPVLGKERYSNSPDIPGMLIWQPVFADISGAGDLGYTSGPYEFRKGGAEHPGDGYGHFVSIWQKQADNSWKVIIDVGISHPAPAYYLDDTVLVVSHPDPIYLTSLSSDTSLLLQLDGNFSNTASIAGYHQALENFASSDIRIYRENYVPFIGIKEIKENISGPSMWHPLSAGIAASGDLGYTYGIASSDSLESGFKKSSYLRIWKRQADDSWKLVLEITNPIPN